MSGEANMRRSQAIQLLPVDSVLATLILHDGQRSEVLVFIPPGETITRVVSPGPPFVPMIRNAAFCLVARDAIAALGVAAPREVPDDDAFAIVHQRSRITLRSGAALEGDLRWVSLDGHKRTSDHVNDDGSHLVLFANEPRVTYYIVKAQIAVVEEIK